MPVKLEKVCKVKKNIKNDILFQIFIHRLLITQITQIMMLHVIHTCTVAFSRAHPVSRGMEPLCMVMTYIPSDVSWHKNQGYVLFRGGDLNGFWYIRALSVSGRTGPSHIVMTYILSRCSLTQEVRDTRTLPVQGGEWTIPYGHDLYTIRCSLTQKTRINMI
jgi:hypothetical protein